MFLLWPLLSLALSQLSLLSPCLYPAFNLPLSLSLPSSTLIMHQTVPRAPNSTSKGKHFLLVCKRTCQPCLPAYLPQRERVGMGDKGKGCHKKSSRGREADKLRVGSSRRSKEVVLVLWVPLHQMNHVSTVMHFCSVCVKSICVLMHTSALCQSQSWRRKIEKKTEKVLRTIFMLKKKKALPCDFYLNFSPTLPTSLSLSLLPLHPPLSLLARFSTLQEEQASGAVSCSSPSRFSEHELKLHSVPPLLG